VNVFGVKRRFTKLADNMVDRESCYSICAFTDAAPCTKTTVINSIVAGCPYAGFIAPGYSCADPVGASTTNVFKNNVAHSINGSGFGFFPLVNVPGLTACFQASDIKAYKCDQAGVGQLTEGDKAIISNFVGVDNTLGITINTAGETDSLKSTILKDSFIYGENSDIAKDCPTGANCWCHDKMGHMSVVFPRTGKTPHNPSASPRPVYK
jgi:hypothetical protein